MKRKISILVWSTLTVFLGTYLECQGQMEKREEHLYDPVRFAAAQPCVDSMAPDLVLFDLDAMPVRLWDFRGKTVVLVKAGYT
jgi:hypothetical protein